MRRINHKTQLFCLMVISVLFVRVLPVSAQYYMHVVKKDGVKIPYKLTEIDSVFFSLEYDQPYVESEYGLSLNADSLTMAVGDTIQLVATVTKGGTEIYVPLKWESDDMSVANVSEEGAVAALSIGRVSITASIGELNAVCCISVIEDPEPANQNPIEVIIDSLAETGLYIGVMGFNQQLYSLPVSHLNTGNKASIDSFIDAMGMKNGTILCYSVDQAIKALNSVALPSNLTTAAIVTFTDGLDQGSVAMKYLYDSDKILYGSDEEYLGELNKKITNSTLGDIPITAYSIGLRGSDVNTNDAINKFRSTLTLLASSESNANEVSNMGEVNTKFQEIAEQLTQLVNYQTISLNIPIVGDGTRIRFTFDNVAKAENSELYIEGTFKFPSCVFTDVEYHGMTSSSGSTINGTINGIFVTLTFDGIHTDENKLIRKDFIGESYYSSSSYWQPNSEFRPDEQPDIVTQKSSAIIMLVLDCSSSLGEQFATAKSSAKSFINTLYNSYADAKTDEENGGTAINNAPTLYSTTPIDLSLAVTWDSTRYYLTKEQYAKANLSRATIEGVTVITGEESFIIALQDEPTNAMLQARAIEYYGSKLPNQTQGQVISARWSYINSAIKDFGGTGLSQRFWTSNRIFNNNKYYNFYTYQGGGSLSSYIEGDAKLLPVRLVAPTNHNAPIIWRDPLDLLLAVKSSDSGTVFYTKDEWENLPDKTSIEILGVNVSTGNNSFIIALQDELTDAMLQARAIEYYGSKLPNQAEGQVISARWSYINSAIKDFGGTGLSQRFWTSHRIFNNNKYYNIYTYQGGGSLSSYIEGDAKLLPVRLIVNREYDLIISPQSMTLFSSKSFQLSSTLLSNNEAISFPVTWETDNASVATVDANGKVTAVNPGQANIIASFEGVSDTCAVTVIQEVTSITISKTSLSLVIGEEDTLSVTSVLPANANDKTYTWSSSDSLVATVDENGKVTAVAKGTATITATANDGSGVSSSCQVLVRSNSCPDGAVDLGLSVYWSTCNLSESGLVNSPEVYGDYFAWGETSSKLNVPYDWSSYKWCNGSSTSLTKYNTNSSYGTVDNKTTLDSEDDVAHVILGGSWRMPTDAEWTELREKCSWTWTSNYNGTGVAGRIVTSNVEGYKDKSIFLPAAGCRFNTNLYNAGSIGYYWSSSLYTANPGGAWLVYFNSDGVTWSYYNRCYGLSVRPVSEE